MHFQQKGESRGHRGMREQKENWQVNFMKAKRAHLSPKHLARRYTGRLLTALGTAARRCGGDGSFLALPSPVKDISHSRDTAA